MLQIIHDVAEQTGEEIESALDVQLVPVSLFWGRSPEKEKSWLKLLLSDGWSVPSHLKQLFIILWHSSTRQRIAGEVRPDVNRSLPSSRIFLVFARLPEYHRCAIATLQDLTVPVHQNGMQWRDRPLSAAAHITRA